MTADERGEIVLPKIARSADERAMLRDFLDFYRAVLLRKASGLSPQQLNQPLPPSDLTLAGLVHHMAAVEEGWFSNYFLGLPLGPPWDTVDWEADPDWELTAASSFPMDVIVDRFNRACERSREIESQAESLDQVTVKGHDDGQPWSLRWIMIHMIEEYARHCGHADFIRQSIDGAVGE